MADEPRTIAQIAQDVLATADASADTRRLAAWVLDHDEHVEAFQRSQARLEAHRERAEDAQLQRIRQRGDLSARLVETQQPEDQSRADG